MVPKWVHFQTPYLLPPEVLVPGLEVLLLGHLWVHPGDGPHEVPNLVPNLVPFGVLIRVSDLSWYLYPDPLDGS